MSGAFKKIWSNLRISGKLAWIFLLTSIIPLVIMTELGFRMFEVSLEKSQSTKLIDIANKKSRQVEDFMNERLTDLNWLSRLPGTGLALIDYSRAFRRGVSSPVYTRLDQKYFERFNNHLVSFGYYDLFLISLDGDIVFTVVRESDFATNLINGPYAKSGLGTVFRNALETLTTDISGFEYYEPSQEQASFIATPVIRENRIVGVLALQLDIERIQSVIGDQTGLGETGETLIGKQSGSKIRYLNLANFDPSADDYLTINDEGPYSIPLKKSVAGMQGFGKAIDVRGEEVIAAWQYLVQLGWGMVVKQDTAETFAEARRLRLIGYTLIVIVILLSSGLILVTANSSIVAPLKELQHVTAELSTGNLSEWTPVRRQDEIGMLASDFKNMADKLSKTLNDLSTAKQQIEKTANELELRVKERTA